MKKFITSVLFISLCAGFAYFYFPRAPVLKSIELTSIPNFSQDIITIDGNAWFENPNIFGLTLKNHNIDVIISGKNVGKVQQNESRTIKAKQDFSIPIHVNVHKKEVFGSSGFVKEVLKSIIDQDLFIQYKGTVDIEILGLGIPVKVDYTDQLVGK